MKIGYAGVSTAGLHKDALETRRSFTKRPSNFEMRKKLLNLMSTLL